MPGLEFTPLRESPDDPFCRKYLSAYRAYCFVDEPAQIDFASPALGADAPALLGELGYKDDQIAALRSQGVLG